MATLISTRELTKSYPHRTLFDRLTFSVSDGDRIGLIGPNGAGKSTLLKILAGREQPDDGEVTMRRGLRVVYLEQDDDFGSGMTVSTALEAALENSTLDPHERETRVAIQLSRLGFDAPDATVDSLSGGWRKRLSIGRALIQEPDLLLLDEPTNHLDLAGVLWLEATLLEAVFPFAVISHDRYLLDNVATRIVEINPAYPGGCYNVDGAYSTFLLRRQEYLEGRQSTEQVLANKVKREVQWMKEGRKAQRIKQQSRKDEAAEMIAELAELRSKNRVASAAADLEFDSTGRKTRKLLRAKGVMKALGGRTLFRDLNVTLSPGTRLGLVGANGSGKTTLIRTLLGQLPADAGEIEYAENVQTVLFDQQREQLPLEKTLRDALCGPSDVLYFRGRPISVGGWAERFLFSTQQLNLPVSELSGGEQARILLARLMLLPADILVLDEPTNDLDIPTLNVLEESIEGFAGAVVLVTHDRYMLDRICTEVLFLEGDGRVGVYGGFAHWEAEQARRARSRSDAAAAPSAGARAPKGAAASKPASESAQAAPKSSADVKKKLTYAEKLELDQIEPKIERAEQHVAICQQAASDPAIQSNHVELQKRYAALQDSQAALDALFARWHELEERRG